ncbi:hypothetical protein [Mycobacterium sp. C31M]
MKRIGGTRHRATVAGLALAAPAALAFLGAGAAHAEVQESAPAPYVTSRQAILISDDALRVADYGQARGFLDTRSAESGIVHAQGEGRDSVKAVPGTTSAPFAVEHNGQFTAGAPIGDW